MQGVGEKGLFVVNMKSGRWTRAILSSSLLLALIRPRAMTSLMKVRVLREVEPPALKAKGANFGERTIFCWLRAVTTAMYLDTLVASRPRMAG